MEAKATAKYIRISHRKMKFICDMVRGKDLDEALAILKFTPKKGARELEKVVKSAAANAENNFDLDRDKLYVSKVSADMGPTLKRWRPRAKGAAYKILKRTSHINVTVEERV
ncbi:large subunit ribosomal protein L22 [Dethiosulfatibacter aminovorans DSM 17477]|uniref:Large ribosomal subunit protein uL22 n=1 Tax=Dethiosulfatibacter aminovorans DSM 17477 TaxID=1121476 RepID=A0A1M6L4Y5_9FIRM|nr:50S ribosomal protein L22 [Dethiosulfatibacter aminovorans]SHJ66272.1 large subunit ribosomal protein L22 [Dethiosulfatibacter aminovorans DSM 17477]